ncbi:MAG: Type II secretory pathway, pullulanase PulA [Alphaproteobacteria bacterium]|nr:MAG: Type II secretory pathway, pullulanase PulA [Alphaproteobacteria bacterium]
MILSRGRRYLFIHVPKTGGTSLALALEARAMRDDILVGDTPKARRRRRRLRELRTRGRLWKHATLADIDGLVTPEDLDRLFVFTLVRNPWDRVVSYYHWLREQRFAHPAVARAKALGFDAFARHPATLAEIRDNPVSRYVTDATGRERCDLFIRLEHLETDIAPLEAHLGFRLCPLPRANVSRRARDFRSYYSDASRQAVGEAAAADIARFGYRFG